MVKVLDVQSALQEQCSAGSMATSGGSGWPAGAPPVLHAGVLMLVSVGLCLLTLVPFSTILV